MTAICNGPKIWPYFLHVEKLFSFLSFFQFFFFSIVCPQYFFEIFQNSFRWCNMTISFWFPFTLFSFSTILTWRLIFFSIYSTCRHLFVILGPGLPVPDKISDNYLTFNTMTDKSCSCIWFLSLSGTCKAEVCSNLADNFKPIRDFITKWLKLALSFKQHIDFPLLTLHLSIYTYTNCNRHVNH